MVKDVLDSLTDAERAQLRYAFDQDFSQEIPQEDGTFIGVNVYNLNSIIIIDQVNNWIHGRRK